MTHTMTYAYLAEANAVHSISCCIYKSQFLLLTVDYRDHENGYTPIMIAAMQGDQIVLDILIACVSFVLNCSLVLISLSYLAVL